jgi:hypothetical protein
VAESEILKADSLAFVSGKTSQIELWPCGED